MSNVFTRAIPVVAAVAAMAAAGAAAAPGPAVGRAAAPMVVSVPPSPTTLVCPPAPALSAAATTAGAAAGFTAQPVAPATTFSALTYRDSGTPAALSGRTLPLKGASAPLAAAGAVVPHIGGDPGAPSAVSAAPAATGASPVGVLTSTSTASGDLAGLAVSNCTPPAASAWLSGAGVAPGRSGRIVLSNAGSTPVSVDLTVLTGAGRKMPSAAQDLVVSPGASRQVLLEALMADTGAAAVGVTASGGQVAANLVDTQLSGIVPRGVEQVGTSQPDTSQVLAPISTAGTSTTLRLANPSARAARVTWRFLGASGVVQGQAAAEAVVQAGVVSEVPVAVPAGARALLVTSDVAVLASATLLRQRAGAPVPAADYATVIAAPALGSQSLVVPGPGTSTLTLVSGDAPATVVVRQVGANGTVVGPDQTLAIAAESAAVLNLADGAAAAEITVRAGDVHGGLLVDAGGFLAATPVRPAAPAQPGVQLSVLPHP